MSWPWKNCHKVTVLCQIFFFQVCETKMWQFSPIFVTTWQKYFCHVVTFNFCDKNYWHRVFSTQCVKNNRNWHSVSIIFATKLSHCTMGYQLGLQPPDLDEVACYFLRCWKYIISLFYPYLLPVSYTHLTLPTIYSV